MRNRAWKTDASAAIREAEERWTANAPDRDLVKVRVLPRKQENLAAAEAPLEE